MGKSTNGISPDMNVSDIAEDVIYDYQMALDMIQSTGSPSQEVLDKVENAGNCAFSTYGRKTLAPPNLETRTESRTFPSRPTGIERISVPRLKSVGRQPFPGCERLKTLLLGYKGDSAVTASGATGGIPSICSIYVADGLVDAYRGSSLRSGLAPQIKPIPELPDADRDLPV